MSEYFAVPNHPLKTEDYCYKIYKSEIGDDFQSLPDYIAWWSAQLFNVGFVFKIEMFQKKDLPEAKMTIKAAPSKVFLTNKVITAVPPLDYSGTLMDYYHHLSDWDIKIETKTATVTLKAEHIAGLLDKGLLLTFDAKSKKGDKYALLGLIIWLLLEAGVFIAHLGIWNALVTGILLALAFWFAVSKIIARTDKNILAGNEVYDFFKKYLVTNFDLTEVPEKKVNINT